MFLLQATKGPAVVEEWIKAIEMRANAADLRAEIAPNERKATSFRAQVGLNMVVWSVDLLTASQVLCASVIHIDRMRGVEAHSLIA